MTTPEGRSLAGPEAGLSLRRAYLAVFLILTGFALVSASTENLENLSEGDPTPFWYPLLWELTGSYAVLPLVPAMYWAGRRLPLRRGTLRRHLPVHLALTLPLSFVHTSTFYLARLGIYRALGLGEYKYGLLGYRYPFEFHKFLVAYAFFQGLAWLWAHVLESREREALSARLARDLAEARLASLQAQVNPHFLFNALNTISSVMYEDPSLADRLISRLAELMRETLAHTAQATVTLAEELRVLDLYVQIMKARFGDRLDVGLEVAPACAGLAVPAFLLQPLVENAIKHHGSGRRAAAADTIIVRVSARREAAALRVAVEDNGPGLPAVVPEGVGLRNLRARLDSLYGAAGRLSLDQGSAGGLRVTIEIPPQAAARASG